MSESVETRGIFTKVAVVAWRLIVLLLVVAGVGFEAARYTAAPHAAEPPAPSAEVLKRLERIERAQEAMQLDVAVIKSQVSDLRDRK